MENKEIVKQMVYLYKTSFHNNFSTSVMPQDQTGKLLKTFVDFKKYVDENRRCMEDFSSMLRSARHTIS
jgi:hypothetical protein